MNRKPHTLNARGLIAAAVAVASGSALAEQAGRVSFVTGDVRATATDGSVRSLARGDIINTGDKINTGAGRLQLRFTDGGFVSLQPNTVFGVDQYLYANKPPEETSLFFSLLQGGMRTVTGAIGKVNKQSYKVRTPVATIGIRGTEFRARVNPKRTVVSVGSGFVNVSNERGNITAGAGQNIEASLTTGPRMTNDEADVNAASPDGEREREQYVAEETEDDRQQRLGDQLDTGGNNLILAAGEPPVYTYVEEGLPNGSGYSLTTTDGNGGIVTVNGLTATFNPTTGAISSLTVPGTNPTSPPSSPQAIVIEAPPGASFSPGTLQFVNTKRFGNIGFGEITNGSTEDNTLGIFPSSVAPGEYFSYMMAVPSAGHSGGKASYTLQGGSAARLDRGETTGKLEHFNFDVDLLSARASIDMLIISASVAEGGFGDISVSGSNLNIAPGSSTFGFTSGLSASGAFCGSLGCSTEISGFFVGGGSQAATSYNIQNSGSSITGYAALGQQQYLEEKSGHAVITPGFSFGTYSNARVIESNGRLIGFLEDCGDCYSTLFESGTLQYSTNTGRSGNIFWGELTNGEGYLYSEGTDYLELASNQYQAYISGPQVTPTFSGTAKYSLVSGSGTPARLNGGSTTGTLSKLDLTLNLGTALAGIDMLLSMSGDTFSANASNLSFSRYTSSTFDINGIYTSSQNGSCSGSCYTNISGFFSGNNGNQLGVGYSISGSLSGSIAGTAVLSQQGAPIPDPSEPTLYSMLTMTYGEGYFPYSHPGTIDATFNADHTIAQLTDLSSCEGSSCSSNFEPGSLQANKVGHSTYLRWGEYSNGTAAVSNISGLPYSLGANQYSSYIIGALLPGASSAAAINGKATATYTLLPGGSAIHAEDSIGGATTAKLDSFVINLNLFSGLADLAMNFSNVGSLAETVTAGASHISLPLLGHAFNTQGDRVDGFPGGFEITSGITVVSSLMGQDSNSFCASSCNAAIYGILAGDSSEIGTSFKVSGAGAIVGVAALGQAIAGGNDNSSLKDSEGYGGYVLAAVRGSSTIFTNANPYSDYTADASFDPETGVLNEVELYDGEVTKVMLNKDTVTPEDTGTYRTLNWGRLTSNGTSVTFNDQTGPLGSTGIPESIHYVVGTITDPYAWETLNKDPSQGGFAGYTATYSVVGKTSPTGTDGSTGTLDEGSLTLHLGALPTLDVSLKATMNNGDIYRADRTGYTMGSGPAAANFVVSGMTTTVNNAACGGSGCQTTVHGFFSGSQAQQAGMSYSITDQRTSPKTINGAAALKIDSLSNVPAGG